MRRLAPSERLHSLAGPEAITQVNQNPAEGIYRLNIPQEELNGIRDGYITHLSNPKGTLYVTEEREDGKVRKEAWFISE